MNLFTIGCLFDMSQFGVIGVIKNLFYLLELFMFMDILIRNFH
jgi:hypothetical protein